MALLPGIWRKIFDLCSGGGWQPREDVPKVLEGIDLPAAARFDDGVNQGAAVAGIGFPDEEPVLLADGRWTNGVFDQVVVDFQETIVEERQQGVPLTKGVVDGAAHEAFGREAAAHFLMLQSAMKPFEDGAGFPEAG